MAAFDAKRNLEYMRILLGEGSSKAHIRTETFSSNKTDILQPCITVLFRR